MIFRDKKTGALLNIRRDEFINDHLYFQEIIRIAGDTSGTGRPRYSRPFDELTSEGPQHLKPR
jgi:hypothetical protein